MESSQTGRDSIGIKKINGILLINPGSLSYPRDGKGQSFMVLELFEGREPEIYHYHLQQ